MPHGTLAPELILHIASFLEDAALNSLLRTSKWHTSLLTPVLYDRAFNFSTATAAARDTTIALEDENTDDPLGRINAILASPTTPGKFSRATWLSAGSWRSEWIVDYLLRVRDGVFVTPTWDRDDDEEEEEEDEDEDEENSDQDANAGGMDATGDNAQGAGLISVRTSLLGCMVAVQNTTMVTILLAQEDVRAALRAPGLAIGAPATETNLLCRRLSPFDPLFFAIKNDDVPMFRAVLDAAEGRMAAASDILGFAIDCYVPPRSRELLDAVIAATRGCGRGIDQPSELTGWPRTPLGAAAAMGHLVAVKALLDAGVDLWSVSRRRLLAVEEALDAEGPAVARLLMEEMLKRERDGKARTNGEEAETAAGETRNERNWQTKLLHRIVIQRRGAMIALVPTLLQNRASIVAQTTEGVNALDLIERWGQSNPFSSWPGPENAAVVQGVAASILAADPGLRPSSHINRRLWRLAGAACAEQNHLLLLSLCMHTGESALNVRGRDGLTALHYICDSERSDRACGKARPARDEADCEMARILLEEGADPGVRDARRGATPLLCAARRHRPLIARLLLEHPRGCSTVDVADTSGTTPLIAAVAVGGSHLGLVSVLLDAGADTHAEDWLRKNALHHALSCGNPDPEIVRLLANRMREQQPHASGTPDTREPTADAAYVSQRIPVIHVAGRKGFAPAVRIFADAGYALDERDEEGEDGCTALRCAAMLGDRGYEFVEEMIRAAGEGIVRSDDRGTGMLVCAVMGRVGVLKDRIVRILRLLVKHGRSCMGIAIGVVMSR
ncbi:hypothetical protein BJY04DRAFT_199175 [Aspergillus karnatakaensis]|uniref:uncharacterized protein n=1 Tax=Aspergillus karnatakaensis TaxID=1810916 RepID=UPI003CCCDC79